MMKSEPILTPESVAEFGPCWDTGQLAKAIHPLKSIGLFAALRKTSAEALDRIWLGLKFLGAKHQRLFACDCVDRALKLIEKPEPRSLEAVKVSRAFANGKASEEELRRACDEAWAYPHVRNYSAVHAAATTDTPGEAAFHAAAFVATITFAAANAANEANIAYCDTLLKERLWQLGRLRFYIRKEYA